MQHISPGFRNFILGIMCLGLAISTAYYFKSNPPAAQRTKPLAPVLKVETMVAKPQHYEIIIESYGTIQARTQGTLTAQVDGEIVAVADTFRAGNFFEKDEVLLEIDPRDYQTTLINAQANLSQAQATLAQEQAQADQAAIDWKRLGNTGNAPDLVLRKPQLAAAQAQLKWNQAALDKAKLDLQRTKVRAPYAGRIISKNVDLGQYASVGMQLAQIFAVDYVEARLPLSSREYAQLDITESYRGERFTASIENSPRVTVQHQIDNLNQTYQGYISRSEGIFDTNTRQTFVVAQIDDPYSKRADGRLPLKVGQFVTAKIQGKTLKDVYVLPNSAIYQGRYIFVAQNHTIQRRDVHLLWQDDDNSVIDEGLNENEIIVLTPLNEGISGTRIEYEPT